MPFPSLSYDNLDLPIVLCRHIGDGVTLIADTASGGGLTANAPVALARPANDDLAISGTKCWQKYECAYGFDHRALYGTNQGIQVVFTSEVAGYVEVSTSCCQLNASATLDFGDYTAPANSASALYVRATIGATTSGGMYATGGDVAPFRDNNQFNIFKRAWFTTTNPGSGGSVQTFAVVKGANTLTIRGYNSLGDGFICEAVYIRLRRHDSDRNLPRRTMAALPTTVNRSLVSDVLETARNTLVPIVFIGDSFATRDDGWARYGRRDLEVTYGRGGLAQRLASGDSTSGVDFYEDSTLSWATTESRRATRTGLSGGAYYDGTIPGARGYKWTTGQTGAVSFSFVGTGWKMIYETGSGFGDFTYSVNGGSTTNVATAGTGDRYAQVGQTGLAYGTHTLTFTKSGAGEVRLFALVTHQDSGIVAMRISKSGTGADTHFAASTDAIWASLLTAFGAKVIIYGSLNNQITGGSESDLQKHAKPLNDRLPTLCDTTGAKFLLAELTPYNAGTYTTPNPHWARNGIPLGEWHTDVMEHAALGQLNRPISFVSVTRAFGYQNTEAIMHRTSGYATQSTAAGTGGGNDTITDFHPSAIGGELLGATVASLIADETATQTESDLATLLSRIPGVVQPQGGDTHAALTDPATGLPSLRRRGI